MNGVVPPGASCGLWGFGWGCADKAFSLFASAGQDEQGRFKLRVRPSFKRHSDPISGSHEDAQGTLTTLEMRKLRHRLDGGFGRGRINRADVAHVNHSG